MSSFGTSNRAQTEPSCLRSSSRVAAGFFFSFVIQGRLSGPDFGRLVLIVQGDDRLPFWSGQRHRKLRPSGVAGSRPGGLYGLAGARGLMRLGGPKALRLSAGFLSRTDVSASPLGVSGLTTYAHSAPGCVT